MFKTELLDYPKPEGQPQHGILSSSDAGAAHGAFPLQIAPLEGMGLSALPQISRDRNANLNDLTSGLTGASGRPRRVPGERDDGEGSTEPHAKLVSPDGPSGNETGRLEDGRLIELERQNMHAAKRHLSKTHFVKTERDRRIAQLTGDLVQKSGLLEQAEKEKRGARLELRELQAKLDESLLSHDHALKQAEANAAEEKERAGLELRKLQAKLDE